MNICQRPGSSSPRSHRDTTHSEHTGGGGLQPAAANTGLWVLFPTPHVHRDLTAKTQVAGKACAKISIIRTRKLANEGCFGTFDRWRTSPGLREGQTWLPRDIQRVICRSGKRFLRRRQGNGSERDWAGSPSVLVICGRSRQTSARQNQRRA